MTTQEKIDQIIDDPSLNMLETTFKFAVLAQSLDKELEAWLDHAARLKRQRDEARTKLETITKIAIT